ncbi:hypothetical protein L2X98_31705 [Microbacterium elymi]|uniref:Uncharacterized protein n=1 Tax=Microbacterium elymi TaxID=2909587 RepID=A0ABY5NII8_9MICO|nr:hypothetical protein [Microbacterium elymi]UUT34951.1 hypothetical protein L2X98_31705 [Microbacterium elymi]
MEDAASIAISASPGGAFGRIPEPADRELDQARRQSVAHDRGDPGAGRDARVAQRDGQVRLAGRQRGREEGEGELGAAVRAQSAVAAGGLRVRPVDAGQAGGKTQLDHHARARGAQQGQDAADQRDVPEQIRLQVQFVAVLGEVALAIAEQDRSGVQHCDVDPWLIRTQVRGERVDGAQPGEIEVEEYRLGGAGRSGGCPLLGADGGDGLLGLDRGSLLLGLDRGSLLLGLDRGSLLLGLDRRDGLLGLGPIAHGHQHSHATEGQRTGDLPTDTATRPGDEGGGVLRGVLGRVRWAGVHENRLWHGSRRPPRHGVSSPAGGSAANRTGSPQIFDVLF